MSRSVRMPIGLCEASTTIAQVNFAFASSSTTSEQRAFGRTERTSAAGRAKSRTSMLNTAVRERAHLSRIGQGMSIHSNPIRNLCILLRIDDESFRVEQKAVESRHSELFVSVRRTVRLRQHAY